MLISIAYFGSLFMLALMPLGVFFITTISIIARWSSWLSNLTVLVVIIAPTAVGIVSAFLGDYCREGQGVVCVQDAA
jgi:hypothetical protein